MQWKRCRVEVSLGSREGVSWEGCPRRGGGVAFPRRGVGSKGLVACPRRGGGVGGVAGGVPPPGRWEGLVDGGQFALSGAAVFRSKPQHLDLVAQGIRIGKSPLAPCRITLCRKLEGILQRTVAGLYAP